MSAVMLCLNGCFKAYFKGPRPYWVSDKVKTLDPTLETSYGFPSGHSTGMIAIYGVIAWHYNIPFFYAVWVVLSLAVMYSRVYTGMTRAAWEQKGDAIESLLSTGQVPLMNCFTVFYIPAVDRSTLYP